MKLLFTTLPSDDLGLLTRSLPIAHILASRGHEIVFSSPAEAPSTLIAAAGFANEPPRHPIFELAKDRGPAGLTRLVRDRGWRGYGSLLHFLREIVPAIPTRFAAQTDEVWNTDHAGAQLGLLNEGFVRANVVGFRRLIEESAADVVVDFWNPLAVIAARSLGTPVVTVIQSDAHPEGAGFRWWTSPPGDLPTVTPVVNRVLADYGLPDIRSLEDLSVGDLTLVVGSRELDPLPEQAEVTYVGSLLWQEAGASLPRSVRSLAPGRPLVWVYAGNPRYGSASGALDSMVVLEAAVAAFARLDVDVVLTTGHHRLPAELMPLPANFVHEQYVPGLALAERCDVLVHHGGYGSCQTGLHAGKPAVIMPTYAERESNARRMAMIGAAIVVPVRRRSGTKHVEASELSSAVQRVLADGSYAEHARRAGERLRANGGAETAADHIERLAYA